MIAQFYCLYSCSFLSNDSPLRKEIVGVWPKLNPNIMICLGNGMTTRFWTDKWLQEESNLSSVARITVNEEDKLQTVSQFLNPQGNWNFNLLDAYLPSRIVQKIRSLPPPSPLNGVDSFVWLRNQNGEFITRSAYNSLMESQNIWKWQGPQMMKIFLWQTTHNRLLTTAKRSSWSGDSPDCKHCTGTVETIIHALRDCPVASRTWIQLVASPKIALFFWGDLEQ